MNDKGDTLVFGGLAGLLAALAQAVFGITAKALHLTDRTFIDFGRFIVMYKDYHGVLAWVVGLIAHLVVGSTIGVLFALLIKRYTPRYIYLKGMGMGFLAWYALAWAGTIFRIPRFVNIPPGPALETFVAAGFYGLVLAFPVSLFNERELV